MFFYQYAAEPYLGGKMVSRICQLLPSFGGDISSEPSEKRNLTCGNMYFMLQIELIILIITHNFPGLFRDLFNSFLFWLNRPKKTEKLKKLSKLNLPFGLFLRECGWKSLASGRYQCRLLCQVASVRKIITFLNDIL